MENPYTPPSTTVEDPVQYLGPRPAAVTLAAKLMWAALLVGLVSMIPGVRNGAYDGSDIPIWVTVVLTGVFFALYVFLIRRILQGRNWARWTLIGLHVVSWIVLLTDSAALRAEGVLANALDLLIMALEVYGSILLLWGEGGKWFQKKSNSAI